ncbi:MAG: hypothetical protein KatS3mg065_0882 [Chloroflexota bacterium]|nr:MAG: hypothetical protein KatS3mg065_0882 [Chloroflexota bacterium]
MCYDVSMRTVSQRELRNQSATVIRLIQAGESVIVTRSGQPVAELRPIGPGRPVHRDVAVASARRLPPVDPRRFRADLDAVVDPWLS